MRKKITQTSRETETGTTFTQFFPKGTLYDHCDAVIENHVTDYARFRKYIEDMTTITF